MRKSKTAIIYFYFCFFTQKKLYFILLENIFGKTQFTFLHFYYSFFHRTDFWKCSNKTQMPIYIYNDPVIHPKILGNRIGILPWILIKMEYHFCLYMPCDAKCRTFLEWLSNEQRLSQSGLHLTFYQQNISKNKMLRNFVPSPEKNYHCDFPQVAVLKHLTKGAMSSSFCRTPCI